MKATLTTVAAIAFTAALSVPALAQQANEEAAATKSGGQCAFSQAIRQAIADGEQQQMAETKSKINTLLENALASPRAAKLAQSTEQLEKATPEG